MRRLFFPPPCTRPDHRRRGWLLDAARDASDRQPANFDKHRRAVFRLFAHLLIEFMTGRQDLPTPLAVAGPPPSAVSSTPAAAVALLEGSACRRPSTDN